LTGQSGSIYRLSAVFFLEEEVWEGEIWLTMLLEVMTREISRDALRVKTFFVHFFIAGLSG